MIIILLRRRRTRRRRNCMPSVFVFVFRKSISMMELMHQRGSGKTLINWITMSCIGVISKSQHYLWLLCIALIDLYNWTCKWHSYFCHILIASYLSFLTLTPYDDMLLYAMHAISYLIPSLSDHCLQLALSSLYYLFIFMPCHVYYLIYDFNSAISMKCGGS